MARIQNPRALWTMLLVVCGIALVTRVWVAVTQPVMLHDDAKGYDQVAQSIVQGDGFSRDGKPTAIKDPLYPGFLAAVYRLFGHDYRAVQVVQAVFNAIACAAVAYLGMAIGGSLVGWLSGLGIACYPSLVYLPRYLLTEALFIPLLLLALVAYLKWRRTTAWFWSVTCGALFGLAALTRSSIVLLPVVLAGGEWWPVPAAQQDAAVGRRRRQSLTLLVALGLTIAPWTLRNYLVFHTFIPISTKGGLDLYSCYFPPDGKRFGLIPNDANVAYARSMASEVAASRFLTGRAIEFILHHPRDVFQQLFLKALFLITPFDWEILGYRAYNLGYSLMLPWAIVGFYAARRQRLSMRVCVAPVVYYVALSLLVYGSPRVRLPMEPLLIICAAIGCLAFVQRTRSLAVSGVTLAVWLLLNVAVWRHADALRLALKHWLHWEELS